MARELTLSEVLMADLYRIDGQTGWKAFFRHFFTAITFRYVALFRLCKHSRRSPLTKLLLYPWLSLWFTRMGARHAMRIPLSATVGPGLYLGHHGSIWVNPEASIGANCTFGHDVTLGRASRGPTMGAPTLGDRVYLGPGAKIVGAVKIGTGALISANTLVIADVPEKGVVIGVPGRVISHAGSEGYVTHCWEPPAAS